MFGWAVCSPKRHILHVLASGQAAHAEEATTQALLAASGKGMVAGVGIDAPLFWAKSGGRDVDNLVRRAIQQLGAPYPGGTVQHINALRGACLVQGILTANFLHKQSPDTAITESHPKALLYLLGIANRQRDSAMVSMADLSNYVVCEANCDSQHKRDAALGALTAFAQKKKTSRMDKSVRVGGKTSYPI